MDRPSTSNKPAVIGVQGLEQLIQELRRAGLIVIGPAARDGAIVYDRVESVSDLPAGWTDSQAAGKMSLARSGSPAFFLHNAPPQSWKKILFPPELKLWNAERNAERICFDLPQAPAERYAFLGARSCDLHAIAMQDRIFMGGSYVDRSYKERRERVFVVAVNCAKAGGTCFCVSMGTGPGNSSPFDILLTELADERGHRFILEYASPEGEKFALSLPSAPATDADLAAAREMVERTAASMGRQMDTGGIKELIYGNLENPRWDDVASRCLSCTNCTLVCPTCFCHSIEDTSDLSGAKSERVRRWDSCFARDHSYIHGGFVRPSIRARYRQWLSHKLASWIDQFGASGCVGCGRCITWCPAGIDITEEIRAIRESDMRKGPVNRGQAGADSTPSEEK